MSFQAKRQQRNKLAAELKALVSNHPKDQEWTPEHQTKYENMVNDIAKIDAELEREQKVLDIQASNALSNQQRADQEGISVDEATELTTQEKQAFKAWLVGGPSAMTEEQRTIMAAKMNSPRNTMSTGTGSEGGYLTETEMAPGISQAMKAYGGMRNVATVIQSATGSSMNFPTADATSEAGEILGENSTATDEDTSFGTLAIDTYKFSSKVIAVPFELLQDSLFDLEGYVNDRIGQRLGRSTENYFINGTGTSQPHGLIAGISSGKVGATGKTTDVDFEDLTDLEHSVDPAYRASGNCAFMFHDGTLKVLKKKKDSQGRPIWLPGHDVGAPPTINGYQYVINQHMAQMAANAKSIAFGDMSKYVIRDVMQILFFRFTDSAYARKGQVGFLAMMRSGGRFIDVGGAVKYYQNSAS